MWSFYTEKTAQAKANRCINKTLEEVFGFVAVDFVENYPRWSPEVDQVVAVSDEPMQVGSRIHQRRIDGADRIESVLRVTVFQRNRQFSYENLAEPYTGDFAFSDSVEQGVTDLTFNFQLDDIELAMRPFLKLIRTAIEEGVTQTVVNIKELMEKNG